MSVDYSSDENDLQAAGTGQKTGKKRRIITPEKGLQRIDAFFIKKPT